MIWTNLCKAEKEADSSKNLQNFWWMLEHLFTTSEARALFYTWLQEKKTGCSSLHVITRYKCSIHNYVICSIMCQKAKVNKKWNKDVFLQNHRDVSPNQTLPGFVYCWTGHSSPASSQGWFLCRYSSISKMSPAASPVLAMWQDKYQESHSNNCAATTTRVLWKKSSLGLPVDPGSWPDKNKKFQTGRGTQWREWPCTVGKQLWSRTTQHSDGRI